MDKRKRSFLDELQNTKDEIGLRVRQALATLHNLRTWAQSDTPPTMTQVSQLVTQTEQCLSEIEN